MNEDAALLSRYAAEQSEAAFAELTRRHVDLVYSAALRLMRGDVPSAQDVTQQVFTEVARQAQRLVRHPALVGWLYTTTRQMALRMHRTEQRRQAREQEAYVMNELLHDDTPPADWNQLRPVLEDAMDELDDKDRYAVLLRYFQNKTLREVGAALELTDNAARMRVERALDKLRGKLVRRGITISAAALAAAVSANAVQAAPAAFAAALSTAALAGSAVSTSTFITATQTLAMTTFQKTIVAAALAAAVGTGIYATHRTTQLNARVQALQQERGALTEQIQQLEQDRTQVSNRLAALTEENAGLKSGRTEAELLRLRGQVGSLRKQSAAFEAKASQSPGGLAGMLKDPAMKGYMQKAMKDKMKSLYGDFIKQMNLTPEQTEQFLQVLTESASQALARLTSSPSGTAAPADAHASQDIASQYRELLGDEGCARLKQFSEEMPARATVSMLNDQLGGTSLSEAQNANLVKVITAEPTELTQGILGSPDHAFLGSQADIDDFLQRVAQSNQRVVQQAASFLTADQLTALDGVLTKGIEARKLQGAAFFQKH